MKQVKFLLTVFLTALYVSNWWALARWPHERFAIAFMFFGVISTIVFIIAAASYCTDHWKE